MRGPVQKPVTLAAGSQRPLPESSEQYDAEPGSSHSLPVCGPYFATENDQPLVRTSFAMYWIVGIVSSGSAPAVRVASRNALTVEPFGRLTPEPETMRWK